MNILLKFKELHQNNYFRAYMVTELARFLGISRMTIHRWLKGLYKPSEEQEMKIRQFLELEQTRKRKVLKEINLSS